MPTRRQFLAGLSASIITPKLLTGVTMASQAQTADFEFPIDRLIGNLKREVAQSPLQTGTWYTATQPGDGLSFIFEKGLLKNLKHLTADLLTDGFYMQIFSLILQEGLNGPKFGFQFATLAMCQARLRMPLSAVSQNRWLYDREGALLKPMCWGDRVELNRVDRMTLTVLRKVEGPVRFCITPVRATMEEPSILHTPLLTAGVLIDELGQSALRDWPGKTKSTIELSTQLKSQIDTSDSAKWPDSFSKWGGAENQPSLAPGTGFFRTFHDGKRWLFLDPDGKPFWSSGIDCVSPDPHAKFTGLESALAWLPKSNSEFAAAFSGKSNDQINYLITNLIRTFGADQWQKNWARLAISNLRRFGFNTVGNWSTWQLARGMKFPYVRPIEFVAKHAAYIYRDFPDCFDPQLQIDADAYAQQLKETADDPALIGYFLMNEPQWGFSKETPAAGMLFNTEANACRTEMAKHLREKYQTNEALTKAWAMEATFERIATGRWYGTLSDSAEADLSRFSTIMVDRLFTILTDACKKVDPNHLNLGARYYTVPPEWALAGMKRFDVFSINCYRDHVPADELANIGRLTNRPTLIGEWHFGALDAGLPASGIGRVKDQAARGQAFRYYVEQAITIPWCVGVHYFILYDQSALGRFDGENYNIGFLDICNRPYEALANSARETHERLYDVVSGKAKPFNNPPEYLPKIFC